MNNKLNIIFVINGKEQPEEVNVHEPLGAARAQALAHSKNTGRAPEEWTIYSDDGKELDPAAKIETFRFPPNVRLTLTLKVGAGG